MTSRIDCSPAVYTHCQHTEPASPGLHQTQLALRSSSTARGMSQQGMSQLQLYQYPETDPALFLLRPRQVDLLVGVHSSPADSGNLAAGTLDFTRTVCTPTAVRCISTPGVLNLALRVLNLVIRALNLVPSTQYRVIYRENRIENFRRQKSDRRQRPPPSPPPDSGLWEHLNLLVNFRRPFDRYGGCQASKNTRHRLGYRPWKYLCLP
jgi:hypothetical protein